MKYLTIFLLLIFNIQIFSQSSWTEQTITPTPPKLNCVSSNTITTIAEGWIGGDSGTILYTSNSGTNWFYRNNSVIGIYNVIVIQSIRANPIYSISGKALCSANSSTATYIYRTTNQGINWSIVYQQPNGRIRSISMLDTATGFAIGDPVGGRWTILKTINGGVNFDSAGLYLIQNGNEISNYNCSFYAQSVYNGTNYLMFGTNSSRLYRSTNNGSNWTSIVIPIQNIYTVSLLYDCDFIGMAKCNYLGYVCGNGSDTTETYGQSWGPVTLPGTGDIHTLYSEIGYCCYAKGSNIYSSTNFSSQFGLQYTSPNGGNYIQISLNTSTFESYGSRCGWGVKDNGTVSKYYMLLIGVKKIGYEVPNNFSLFQNYPNPFNPSTIIKFDVGPPLTPLLSKKGTGLPAEASAQAGVVLKIYDILGREVATLVNEKLQPGTYEVEWDASNYPSGVYFYRLETQGFSQTKKLVLIK